MKTQVKTELAEKISSPAAPLQIVLVHDDEAMAANARALVTSFISRFAPNVDVHRDEWNFAELEHPKCKSESLELAKDCDILTIALGWQNDSIESTLDWVQDWLRSRNPRESAVIICAPANDPRFRIESLSALLKAEGLAVFSTVIPLVSQNGGYEIMRSRFFDAENLPEYSVLND